MIIFRNLICRSAVRLFLLIFPLTVCCQETPQLDTLTLNTGLKIYLLRYGADSVLNVRLVIDGGKKNETQCQVGYAELIQQLLQQSLNGKQAGVFEKKNRITCKIRDGQTLLNGNCLIRNFNKEMELLSTVLSRQTFTKDKMDKAVSFLRDHYNAERMKPPALSAIYRNLLLYGIKNPLGRTYCEYQLERALPEDLRQFYSEQYTPKNTSLVICGNFNVTEVKKTIAKHFIKWRSLHSAEIAIEDEPQETAGSQNKTIAFINKRNAEHYLLKWLQPAPSFQSADYLHFLIACKLVDGYISGQLKENALPGSFKFKPIVYTSGLVELNAVSGKNEMAPGIYLFDTLLHSLQQFKIKQTELEGVLTNLKEEYATINTPEAISSFYNPLVYVIDQRSNYLNQLSTIKLPDVQRMLALYFSPDAYKLIVVGQEHFVAKQLDTLKNVTRYQAFDFETCDEACKEVVVIKCHCQSCYERGQCYVWRFNPNQKDAIKSAKARAKSALK